VQTSCEIITNENICNTSGAAVSPSGSPLYCFWLYNNTSGYLGGCRNKADQTLECNDAKRSGQCRLTDVNKLNGNCFWLEGNSSIPVSARCEEIVF
jgi:hypothetical protein